MWRGPYIAQISDLSCLDANDAYDEQTNKGTNRPKKVTVTALVSNPPQSFWKVWRDREQLWNAVERVETKNNAQRTQAEATFENGRGERADPSCRPAKRAEVSLKERTRASSQPQPGPLYSPSGEIHKLKVAVTNVRVWVGRTNNEGGINPNFVGIPSGGNTGHLALGIFVGVQYRLLPQWLVGWVTWHRTLTQGPLLE